MQRPYLTNLWNLFLGLFCFLTHQISAYPYLYAATGAGVGGEVAIFDIGNPAVPIATPASPVSIPRNGFLLGLSANGQCLYLTDAISGFVSLLNIVDPASPTLLPPISPLGTQPWGCILSPNGRYLYVGDGISGTLEIADITLPFNPSAYTVPYANRSNYLTLHPNGKYLYTLGGNLAAFDLSNQASPNLVSNASYSNLNNFTCHPNGSCLYASDGSSNLLRIFSLADPTSPFLLTFAPPTGSAPTALLVSPTQKYLYVANSGSNTLSVFNLTDPLAPFLQTTISSASLLQPSFLIAHPTTPYLYVANQGVATFSIFDISSEANPIWVQDVTLSHSASGMIISAPFPSAYSHRN